MARAVAVSALLAFTLAACCSGKLVSVPLADGGGTEMLFVEDSFDAGFEIVHEDAGVRDAGMEHDAGPVEDGGPATSGGGGGTTGGLPGGGTGGSGGSTGSVIGGGATSGGTPYVDAGPTCAQDPDLEGDWAMTSTYDMTVAVQNGGMPGLVSFFVDMNNFLSTLAGFGVPVPQWAVTLFGNLANHQQLFQTIWVQSDLYLTPGSDSMTYTAQETWQQVDVIQNGSYVPLNSNVGFTSPPAYQVTTCSGTATFAQHDLGGSIAQLIPAVIDGIVNVTSCANGQCYGSLDDAVNAALDCSQYSGSGYLFCLGASAGLESELQNALNGISFPVGVCTVQGTATIQPGVPLALINGVWSGQLSGVPFPGTFQATHN